MASSVLVAALSYALGVKTASADCVMEQLVQFPEPPEILPTNGRIVLSLSNIPMPPLELRSGGAKVTLRTVQTFSDAEGFIYSVLAPAGELRAKSTYSLYDAAKNRPLTPISSHAREVHTISFSTSEGVDRVPPRWRSDPYIGEQVYDGADSYVVLGVAIDEAGPLRVRADVTPADGGSRGAVSYLRVPKSGRIRIGHSLCEGQPEIRPGTRYTVKLTAIDAAGNESAAPGQPLKIIIPPPPAPH